MPSTKRTAVRDKANWSNVAVKSRKNSEHRAPNEVKATLMTLACRVEINPDRVEIKISRHRLAAFLTGQPIDPTMQDAQVGPRLR